mmetsp:Transcript_54667/g.147507  ORF Transcript_54667/g.147507 Transcript_54667/m.147507 type:complete len:223 (+) Transcript_54667:958-1626(+)
MAPSGTGSRASRRAGCPAPFRNYRSWLHGGPRVQLPSCPAPFRSCRAGLALGFRIWPQSCKEVAAFLLGTALAMTHSKSIQIRGRWTQRFALATRSSSELTTGATSTWAARRSARARGGPTAGCGSASPSGPPSTETCSVCSGGEPPCSTGTWCGCWRTLAISWAPTAARSRSALTSSPTPPRSSSCTSRGLGRCSTGARCSWRAAPTPAWWTSTATARPGT